MQLKSVNVGLPRDVSWKGRTVSTGIFKSPVDGPVAVRKLNLVGDRQADLSVHGGPDKAIYAYPIEHYEYWRDFLKEPNLPPGSFGENLTVEGLLEEEVHIGDSFRIGTAEFVVTQPRSPCYKLAIKFGRSDIVRRFLESDFSGFYFSVKREGEVREGDSINVLEREAHRVRVVDLNRIQRGAEVDPHLFELALQVAALPEGWRSAIQSSIS